MGTLVGGLVSFNINHKINNRKVTAPVLPAQHLGPNGCGWPSVAVSVRTYLHLHLHLDMDVDTAKGIRGYGHFKGRDRDLHDVHAGSTELRSMNIRLLFYFFLFRPFVLLFGSLRLSPVQLFCRFHVCFAVKDARLNCHFELWSWRIKIGLVFLV